MKYDKMISGKLKSILERFNGEELTFVFEKNGQIKFQDEIVGFVPFGMKNEEFLKIIGMYTFYKYSMNY